MCFHFCSLSEKMGQNSDFHDPIEEADEALSLCDLPLHENNGDSFEEMTSQARRSSTERHDQFFEFLSDLSSEMCPAEDIIFCGKLVPFKEQPSSPKQRSRIILAKEDKTPGALRRRSESLSELETYSTHSNSTKNYKLLRTSRSLDYQKLRRFCSSKSSPETDMERSSSVRSVGKSDKKPVVKPRWYFPMFGMLKFPPEMDLRDIKSRQIRRSSSVMFPSVDAGGNFTVNRSSGKGSTSSSSSWRFIKALSCKDHASVAATTPLCVSHA
ncbi:3-oxoacyl-[acyl-carrier-protein] synthase 3 protein 3 [Melia azedarach]|uniref:3-oxoacyl-[acyl-carrier-protein] synthase 3 protein 3 n=1 Tax=Melia azedarach TaxID=155640 RepID=A0ACC1XDM0_MELAZ|nr:3-oxoacyl-[acyl-carrier-protein] synthase 3 protein 3 [Melia azedarach]